MLDGIFFFFKQKTAYEMRISDWSSDVCSSDVDAWAIAQAAALQEELKAAYGRREFHLVYHKLHNYCVTDLGGLYLDILKDRLYTLPKASLARRSAQTALRPEESRVGKECVSTCRSRWAA